MADDTRDDEQVRRDEATASSDAVEQRAIGGGTVLTTRRAQTNPKAKRAESRGIYLDPISQARRVVGQGQVIPDGWTRIESATVEDRSIEHSRAAHAQGDVLNAGGEPTASPASAAPRARNKATAKPTTANATAKPPAAS